MKNYKCMVVLIALLASSSVWAGADASSDSSVGSQIKQDATTAGHDIAVGAKHVGSDIKQGGAAFGHAVAHGAKETGHFFKHSAHVIGTGVKHGVKTVGSSVKKALKPGPAGATSNPSPKVTQGSTH